MHQDPIVFTIFLVFTGAAVFATIALFARQSLLVAYIVLGALFGPSALGLVSDPELIRNISEFGIMFLLFLLGLNLQPQELVRMVRKTTQVTLLSSLVFFAVGFLVSKAFGFTSMEALLVGGAATFSSTIVGLKLLPTTMLHHQRTGEVIISILLMQDLLAIVLLLVVQGGANGGMQLVDIARLFVALPALIGFAWMVERYVLIRLIRKFDKIQEYIFLVTIGWCLGMAELAGLLGLSAEIGAFIAGVVLASSPIAMFIAESLKPLRDFFLVLFFFSLGAGFDISVIDKVILPALIVATAMMLLKPLVFRWLLLRTGESEKRSHEVGYRLGQMSEFSLLLAVLAFETGVIGAEASYLIQLSTLLTFLVSSYIVVLRFPTPIAVSDALRRD
ncbi:MAG: cation:proton antiporter [Chromatiaceae bacterium]|nr:cation:proton antiporter [Gammaproteobacteria bacterium]MCP5316552.1 cation:proton antiporter [Chromatiaceae bacterium]MCW5585813.1 cation:proton antiporter [Chromatiales bacterium]MCP5429505.1 cation:proton antiporter [Chromatiaceae bacterium]MCP5434141.1 cation:proton antiporter [Chromatiaceae bacterium]